MTKERSELQSWFRLSLLPSAERVKKVYGNKPRIYLGDSAPGVYFTKREAECVYCLMIPLKRRAIAVRLVLSRRTVDAYIESAKRKLECRSHQQLLRALRKTDFIKNMDTLRLI